MKQAKDCVGIVCFKNDQVLLIKRGKPPRMGQWSIPGGGIEPGESEIEACHRELMEETGIKAEIVTKVETIRTDFGSGPYVLNDYLARWIEGVPEAGDDAAHAEFIKIAKIKDLNMWSETERIIEKAYEIFCDNAHFQLDKI